MVNNGAFRQTVLDCVPSDQLLIDKSESLNALALKILLVVGMFVVVLESAVPFAEAASKLHGQDVQSVLFQYCIS